jgi:hypothetical protein
MKGLQSIGRPFIFSGLLVVGGQNHVERVQELTNFGHLAGILPRDIVQGWKERRLLILHRIMWMGR